MEDATKIDQDEFADLTESMQSRWVKAVEEMTFFGVPVSDLPLERLLMVVGMLACENRRLQDESRRTLQMYRVR